MGDGGRQGHLAGPGAAALALGAASSSVGSLVNSTPFLRSPSTSSSKWLPAC